MNMSCQICAATMHETFRARVLGRHEAIYDHCASCGYLRVRAPHWIEEAYSESIAVTDTGILLRNTALVPKLLAIAWAIGAGANDRFLDYAGGYGILTRLMRDAGLDFYWTDRYSPNLVARGFEYCAELGPCRAVTAFEVIEHVEDPRAFVMEVLEAGHSDTLIFSTELYEGDPPRPEDWWYYSFETGQHISFFRRDTLERLAARLDLNFHSAAGLHFLSARPLPARRLDAALGRLNRAVALAARAKRTGLTMQDHARMVAHLDRQQKEDGHARCV